MSQDLVVRASDTRGDRPHQISQHYQYLLRLAAGNGFVSVRRRGARARVIEGALKRGYRRVRLEWKSKNQIAFSGWYGHHRVTRCFMRNADGSIPDGNILDAMRATANRMDARRPGGRRERKKDRPSLIASPHPIYVTHGNEHAKLHELVRALPPNGGMSLYLAAMSANERDMGMPAAT